MKLYKSKDWLYRRYVVQRKSMEEIAKECGVTTMTIYRALKDNGLKLELLRAFLLTMVAVK